MCRVSILVGDKWHRCGAAAPRISAVWQICYHLIPPIVSTKHHGLMRAKKIYSVRVRTNPTIGDSTERYDTTEQDRGVSCHLSSSLLLSCLLLRLQDDGSINATNAHRSPMDIPYHTTPWCARCITPYCTAVPHHSMPEYHTVP